MRFRRLAGAWLALLMLVAFAPERAHAHGALKRSRPAARDTLHAVPRELRLEFTESPELAVSALHLIDPAGREVPLSPLRTARDSSRVLLADIGVLRAPGRYTVRWQIAGADGHPVSGEFTFLIAEGATGLTPPPESPAGRAPAVGSAMSDSAQMIHIEGFGAESIAYVFVRWLQFIGLVVVIGAVAFNFLMLGGWRRDAASAPLAAAAASRASGVAALGAVVLAVSSGARLVAQWAALGASPGGHGAGTLSGMVMQTAWGRAWMLQVVGITILTIGLLAMRRRGSGTTWAVAALAAVLLALSIALASHAGATGSALATVLDVVHVIAAGGWMGGLAMLVLVGFPVARTGGRSDAGAHMARLVHAFTPTALACAALLLFTGVSASWRNLETLGAFTGSRYGRVLLVKLALLVVAAGIGFYNFRRARPRLGASGDDATVRRAMRAELAVGTMILLVTAVLVAIPTPADVPLP